MPQFPSRTINGLHFIAGGWPLAADLPTLVFIHGSGGAVSLWHRQMAAFAGVANTVALDLPGHGRSDGPGQETVAAYARGVAAFIRRLDAPRPVPCGLSIGGAIVLQLLLDDADVAHAGILINTGARLRVTPVIFDLIARDYDAFLDLVSTMGAAETTDPACLGLLMADSRACPPAVAAGDFRACDAFDVMDRLALIQRPVLVLSADQDRLTPPKYADHLAAGIHGAASARIAGAGHLSPLEQPQAVNAAIGRFLSATVPPQRI